MLFTIATIKAKAGSEAEFEAAAQELAKAVNANEPGCLQYVLCKGEEPSTFYFVESYKDAEAVEAHRKSDHFRTLGRAMGAFMDGPPSILRLTAA
ncbi:MAG: putative quinol monooxygenase [Pseudomonadota bacterium]|nr:putative quinol monooxygenase [Pseudomonadota bacterium]MEE3101081.1 putative quinol monooxygenase [Pseudomonadota bacterium]